MEDQRPSYDKIYMDFALALSERSTCSRLHVGAVVVSTDKHRVMAIGYNGNYAGGPNRCDSDEAGNCGCIHAESNCLIKMDYNDPSKKIMYLTTAPCKACAKLIVNSGIREVVYLNPYRKTDGLEILDLGGLDYRQF